MIALLMITLPAVLPTISRASRIGTPDDSRVPRVRVKRATAIFCITGPTSGILSMTRSIVILPVLVRDQKRQPTTKPTTTTMMMMMFETTKCDRAMMAAVSAGSASAAPNSENIRSKVGITKTSITEMTEMAITTTPMG